MTLGKRLGLFVRNRYERVIAPKLMAAVSPDAVADCRFGFFGEFGYALASWLPYLNYLSSRLDSPLKTCGPIGSEPFYYFSSDHLEVACKPLDMWGDACDILPLRRVFTEKLVCPANWYPRTLSVCGIPWSNPELHGAYSTDAYRPLNFQQEPIPQLPTQYVVINVKDYHNWKGYQIPNYYNAKELECIADICEQTNTPLVLNRFPAPREEANDDIHEPIVTPVLLRKPQVIDMRGLYEQVSSLAERNVLQIRLLRHAKHILSCQGGNAYLAILLNKSVDVLMRGGFDYPDIHFLAKMYDCTVKLSYSIDEFLLHKMSKA
jgi:hypothetical protein